MLYTCFNEKKRKKEASKVKQTTRQSNTAHLRQSLFLTTLHSRQSALPAEHIHVYMPMQCTIYMYMYFSTSSFLQAIITVANADSANTSLRDRMTFVTPQPQLLRKMAGLLHTQLQSGCGQRGGVSGDVVLHFWLHVLLSYPGWHKWVMMSCDVM